MIVINKNTLTEQQLRDMTKNYIGIRYRTHKDGCFEAYINPYTFVVDICKKIKKFFS